ncbi:MAG: hypothetical protein MJ137_08010 [Clostridia bacterium]|nr:hypothetical protein [Clostridia bacterium]
MNKNIKLTVRRAAASLLAVCTLLAAALFPSPAATVTVPTDETMFAQISTIYQRAIDFDYKYYRYANGNYTSKCAHYVHVQLIINGVNTGYVSGNGNDEYDNYKNKAYSTGGRKIHAYDASKWSILAALKDISSQTPVATNILVGFQSTITASGKLYGHAMVIHGIIGNYVYFTDNLSGKVGGRSFKMGDPVKCTIEEFNAFYGRPSVFGYEGIIWFEDTALTSAAKQQAGGEATDPDTPSAPEPENPSGGTTTDFETGEYSVTYPGGLRIRAGAGTNYATLEILPYRASVFVTEISNGFGHVNCTVEGVEYDGWISLSYAERIGALHRVSLEELGTDGKPSSQQWFDSIAEALVETSASSRLVLYGDVTSDADVVIGKGTEIVCGNYDIKAGKGALSVRGGKITANRQISAVAEDPFVTENKSGTVYTYTCDAEITVNTASLVIGNNVSLRFKAQPKLPGTLSGAKYTIVCDNIAGGKAVFEASEVSDGTSVFVTEGIPAKFLGDRVTVRPVISSTVNGKTYTLTGDEMIYSAVEYVGSLYNTKNSNDKLDRMLASMLNYSAAAQTYFGYATDKLSNRGLPAAAQKPSAGNDNIIAAEAAPDVDGDASALVTGAQLVIGDSVSMKFGSEGTSSAAKLLVWTAADFAALDKSQPLSGVMTEKTCSFALDRASDGSFSLEDIPAKKYADTYYFRLCDTVGGKTVYGNVFTFSVTGYCEKMLNNGVDDKIDGLCRAICDYSAAARDYFGYTINSAAD